MCTGFDYGGGGGGAGGYGGFDQQGGAGFGGFDGGMEGGDMGGGGFDAMNNATGEAKSAEKKSFKNKTCMAVTIRQIKTGERDAGQTVIDKLCPEMVKIMGTVISKESTSTAIEFSINDGTGQISTKLWVDKGSSNEEAMHKITEGSFVSVIGALKEYNDIISLQVFKVFPVEDWNAMTHHLLEVILMHNTNLKGPVPGSEAAKAAEKNVAYNMGMGGNMMMQSPAGPGGQRATNDSGVDEMLLKAIKATSGREEGTTVEETFEFLMKNKENITREKVDEKVRQWHEDGLLYGTIDDQHFKSCDE